MPRKTKLGGLVSKVKGIAKEAKDKILHDTTTDPASRTNQEKSWKFGKQDSSSTSDWSAYDGIEVPKERAETWGFFLWGPIEAYFQEKYGGAHMIKSSLTQAETLGHQLGTTGEIRNAVEPSSEGKDFSLHDPTVSSKSLEPTILKAQQLEEDRLKMKSGQVPLTSASKKLPLSTEEQQEHKRAADFLMANVTEARSKGEHMGTTSPHISSTLTASRSLSRSTQSPPPSAADFLRSSLHEARQKGLELGTASPQLSRKSNLHGGNPQASLASHFLTNNLQQARQMGEKMGTTSPHVGGSMKSGQFLKEHVKEARMMGEKMGTTSPHVGGSRAESGDIMTTSDFLKQHVEEARKLGEKMGTTSPHTTKASYGTKGQVKDRYQFFRDNLEQVRKMGERMGTTSPQVDRTKSNQVPISS